MLQSLIDSVVETLPRAPASRGSAWDRWPLPPVPNVDLPRYMGVWYPIACIPLLGWHERACNSVETYRLARAGDVSVRLEYRDGCYSRPLKAMRWTALVRPGSGNAVWDLRSTWPFRAERRIVWVSNDYSQAMVARSRRDFVCYLSRAPQVSSADYGRALMLMARMGFDLAKIRTVPRRVLLA